MTNQVARRRFAKLLGSTSLAFLIETFVAGARKMWQKVSARSFSDVPVASVDEIPVGTYKLFRYPTENDPCILVRLGPSQFAAFNQNCTHLSCPVHLNPNTMRLECPCHRGFFSAEDGRPLAGPARRSLIGIAVSVRKGQVWAGFSEVQTT